MSHSRKPRYDIDIDVLKEHVNYNPVTGVLSWKKQTRGRTLNEPFGRGSRTPYIQFGLSRRILLAHRAAFAIFHGYWPNEVDHINEDKRDNRIANLREATRVINILNRDKPRNNNTSGHTGVCFHTATGRWRAYTKVGGKQVNVFCETKQEAVKARQSLLLKHYPELKQSV
jgi:hypothetical protein